MFYFFDYNGLKLYDLVEYIVSDNHYKMNKKIAIVVCAWPPMGGGIGNNAYYHAKKLAELGYEVEVFTPWYATTRQQEESFKVTYLEMWPRFGMAGFSFSLYGHLKNYDIVHLYSPFFGNDLVVWFFKRFNPLKKLIIHYEMDPIGKGWQKFFFAAYVKMFFGCIVRVADKVVALSWDHAENSYLIKYLKKSKDKFVAIPNGIDIDIFKPQSKDGELMNACGFSEGDKVIIFVGGLDKQHYFKGVDVLLHAFKKVHEQNSDSRLLIVGEGDLKDEYMALAEKLNISDRTVFAGWVDNKNLPRYYSLANVFVLPSTVSTESFGIVIAEAQACGVPAVVSNWPGSRKTLQDNETGYTVKPGDVDDLAEKLFRVLNDSTVQMGEKASVRARELYGWDKVASEIDVLYKSL